MIIQGDCLLKLKELDDNSVDSIVTDPPYELGFMGKSWDNTGIANNVEMWRECLRVLKPGGHLLSFSGTRTYHRMACAIEDAGFEVRDMIEWVYGSGMSKCNVWGKGKVRTSKSLNAENDLMVENGWEGWGKGGLKPAHEPIAFCRKPTEKGLTVAENCLKWGTGGINIDESRVGTEIITQNQYDRTPEHGNQYGNGAERKQNGIQTQTIGRFPANLIHDNSEEVRECFPETKSSKGSFKANDYEERETSTNFTRGDFEGRGDSGNASRFFKSILYYPKASKSERNMGCEGLEENKTLYNQTGLKNNGDGTERPIGGMKNNHPTVKPIALMEYLIKKVTPKGGIVLDPFAGSGSTLVAAKQNGYKYIGIELTPEYIPIIEARLSAVPQKLL
jgi:site-specific DNA-methyltransferase (adenine-specific)